MDVSLTPELEQFVQTEIGSGHYRDPSHLMRVALTHLKLDRPRLPELPATREELELQLVKSVESLERGEGIDGETSRRNMMRWIEAMTAAHG